MLCACGSSEQKSAVNNSDSIARAMDSASANDSLLIRLRAEEKAQAEVVLEAQVKN